MIATLVRLPLCFGWARGPPSRALPLLSLDCALDRSACASCSLVRAALAALCRSEEARSRLSASCALIAAVGDLRVRVLSVGHVDPAGWDGRRKVGGMNLQI